MENKDKTDKIDSNEDNITIPSHDTLDYDSYLKISEILKLQSPLSDPYEHDEHLFILIHQAYELWFKQILHEVDYANKLLTASSEMQLLKTLNRITTIQRVLNDQIDILETMTPSDFNNFRNRLNPASGFQSFQFRLLEIKLGKRNSNLLKFFAHKKDIISQLEAAWQSPSLYQSFLKFCSLKGLNIPASVLSHPVTEAYQGHEIVEQEIKKVYLDPEKHYPLYLLCEAMIDIDEKIALWRYRHVLMVQRMIGSKMGTGGSSGVKYLQSTLNERFFVDIWNARNHLNTVKGY